MAFSDILLTHRARTGNSAAFGTLYDRHAPRVYNLLLRLTGGDRAQAEDLTQETFLAAYRSLPTWRDAGQLSSWLCGVAVRCWKNQCRRDAQMSADPLRMGEADDLALIAADGYFASDPFQHCARRETLAVLDNAIAALPELARAAFVLIYVQQYSYKEAAGVLEIPLGTLQSRLNRAKQALHIRLSAELDPEAAPMQKGANSNAV